MDNIYGHILTLRAIQPDDPAVAAYRQVEPVLLNRLRQGYSRGPWLFTLCQHGCGDPNGPPSLQPTILVLYRSEMDESERHAFALGIDLPVVFFKSDEQERAGTEPGFGDAIASSAKTNTQGTNGGFFRSRQLGKVFGMTCHHVVSDKTSPHGVVSEEEPAGDVSIESPTTVGLQSAIRRGNKQLEGGRRRRAEMLAQIRKNPEDESLYEKLETHDASIAKNMEGLAHLQIQLDDDRSVGKLIYSSGQGTFGRLPSDGNFVQDITATTDLDSDTPVEAQPLFTMDWAIWEPDFSNMSPKPFPKPYYNAHLDLDECISRGTDVYKIGQTTSETFGETNGVYEYRKVAGSTTSDGTALVACEAVVLSLYGGQLFSAGGDSGSIIFDLATNNVVGLLFGGDKLELVSLYTPIKYLLESVRKVSGLVLDEVLVELTGR